MGAPLLVARIVLAGMFCFAGLAKLRDRAGSRAAAADFGVPEPLAGLVGSMLPVAELAVALALLVSPVARFGALGAIALLGCFSLAIGNALAHGRSPDCHCFGQVHSEPASARTLARNLVLLAISAFVAIAGWNGAGISATDWVTRVSAATLVAIAAGVVILALISFQAWFSLQLLSQNGRTLERLAALEETLAGIAGPVGARRSAATADPEPLGAGLLGQGLPVGVAAPAFELAGVDGEARSLASLLAGGRRLLLLFSDAACGPCDALLPDVARWEQEYRGRLSVAVIASGDQRRNREKANRHELTGLLLAEDRDVADAYQAYGTPSAVVVDPDGRVASPVVAGSEAITKLVEQATHPLLPVRQHAAGTNGSRAEAPPVRSPRPDTSRVGQPAPELVLVDLDGAQVALKDLYDRRTLALFWNPGCGFCQRMVADLQAIAADPPAAAPQLVVISSGDTARVREQDLRSRVVFDAEGQAMRAFGAGGTPMGVLIEDGRIASPVVAGADAVLQLMRAGSAE
jgi:thiol-disulfide isomerase/thioredoxin